MIGWYLTAHPTGTLINHNTGNIWLQLWLTPNLSRKTFNWTNNNLSWINRRIGREDTCLLHCLWLISLAYQIELASKKKLTAIWKFWFLHCRYICRYVPPLSVAGSWEHIQSDYRGLNTPFRWRAQTSHLGSWNCFDFLLLQWNQSDVHYRINSCGNIKAHLQRCVQLAFGFLKKFLVNGLEWQFAERGQLELL